MLGSYPLLTIWKFPKNGGTPKTIHFGVPPFEESLIYPHLVMETSVLGLNRVN
jgi:hypothetical protein